jgi:hypothetical protein
MNDFDAISSRLLFTKCRTSAFMSLQKKKPKPRESQFGLGGISIPENGMAASHNNYTMQ